MKDGIMFVGIPESTAQVIGAISLKTGQAWPDVISEALSRYARQVLTEQDLKVVPDKKMP